MADCHLCGSVNLESAEEVFTLAAGTCGEQLARMPDGETGERRMWIWWQIPRFAASPQLVQCGQGPSASPTTSFELRSGAQPGEVEIDLGYAEVALQSYALFVQLKRAGVVPAKTRFQVSLPTQLALSMFMAPNDQAAMAPTLERLLQQEIRKIVNAIPAGDLAIQWDVAIEMGALEGVFETWCGKDERAVLDSLVRHVRMVPNAAELGFHLCYGDGPGPDGTGRHWKEPADTSLLVRVANELVTRAERTVQWIHMPVPIDRADDAYFEPLTGLHFSGGTRLYLGLVHHEDGLEGARRRVKAAARRVRGFGVATECGMGRTPRAVIPEILRTQAELEVPQ